MKLLCRLRYVNRQEPALASLVFQVVQFVGRPRHDKVLREPLGSVAVWLAVLEHLQRDELFKLFETAVTGGGQLIIVDDQRPAHDGKIVLVGKR